jgi:hypothetical protein
VPDVPDPVRSLRYNENPVVLNISILFFNTNEYYDRYYIIKIVLPLKIILKTNTTYQSMALWRMIPNKPL